MAIIYEQAVEEDLNLGYGPVDVTSHSGGVMVGNKIGLHTVMSQTLFNAKTFGCVGDGVTEDTTALQAAITAGSVYFPSGTYITESGITIPSNRMLYFAPGAIVKLINSSAEADEGIFTNADWVNGNSNIHIFNAVVDGNTGNQSAISRHGFYFFGVSNSSLHNVKVYDTMDGDGVYIAMATGGAHADHVSIHRAYFSNCGRNGLSIIDARYSSFVDIQCEDCYHAGIDLEPNHADNRIVQVSFSNVHVTDSTQLGFVVFNDVSAAYNGMVFNNVTVYDCGLQGIFLDGFNRTQWNNVAAILNGTSSANTYSGIYINDCTNNIFTNIYSGGAGQKYGIEEDGTADANTFIGAELYANTTGTHSFAASASVLIHNVAAGLTSTGVRSILDTIRVSTVPSYVDNAAAVGGGLAVGDFYRTGDALKVVHA